MNFKQYSSMRLQHSLHTQTQFVYTQTQHRLNTNCGKFLKEMGIPDHTTCLLRNLYGGQKATVRTGHGTTDWFQIGKGVHQAYLTYMQSTSYEMLAG